MTYEIELEDGDLECCIISNTPASIAEKNKKSRTYGTA